MNQDASRDVTKVREYNLSRTELIETIKLCLNNIEKLLRLLFIEHFIFLVPFHCNRIVIFVQTLLDFEEAISEHVEG